jgi:PmbA protein
MHKQVCSDKLALVDDPTLERGLASRFFDGEGLAARVMPVFDGGILMNYYIDAYYARKLGAEPTAGWPSNVVMKPGSRSLEAMIKDIDQGILVQGFIGGNSNSTTGDFSIGVMGQLIENGQVVAPVNEMNISGNARDFFMGLAEVGNDPYRYSSLMTPSLLFEGVHFSGV